MTRDVPDGMTVVSSDKFYAVINPLDVRPSVLHSPFFCVWELRDRTVVGRSWPGWKNPGEPASYALVNSRLK